MNHNHLEGKLPMSPEIEEVELSEKELEVLSGGGARDIIKSVFPAVAATIGGGIAGFFGYKLSQR